MEFVVFWIVIAVVLSVALWKLMNAEYKDAEEEPDSYVQQLLEDTDHLV